MLTVISPRGGSTDIHWTEYWTVREAATLAAKRLGYSPEGIYTLATVDRSTVLPYEDMAPEHGTYELVDAGGQV